MDTDKIRERVAKLAQKLADLNIDPDDIPEILDQGFDVFEAAVDASEDKRWTFRETANVMGEFGEFVDTVRNARADAPAA